MIWFGIHVLLELADSLKTWEGQDDHISWFQVSYAIGVAEPLSVSVFDYGTGTKSQQELMKIVKENFDLRPGRIVKDLKLKNPIFQQSATYGHFGRWDIIKTFFSGLKLKYFSQFQRNLHLGTAQDPQVLKRDESYQYFSSSNDFL